MIKRSSIHIQQIRNRLFSVPRWLGENVFLGFLILLLLALLISSFVFYRYAYFANNDHSESDITQTSFQEQVLQDVIQSWEDRAVRFEAAGKDSPRKIFSPFQQPPKENSEKTGEEDGVVDL